MAKYDNPIFFGSALTASVVGGALAGMALTEKEENKYKNMMYGAGGGILLTGYKLRGLYKKAERSDNMDLFKANLATIGGTAVAAFANSMVAVGSIVPGIHRVKEVPINAYNAAKARVPKWGDEMGISRDKYVNNVSREMLGPVKSHIRLDLAKPEINTGVFKDEFVKAEEAVAKHEFAHYKNWNSKMRPLLVAGYGLHTASFPLAASSLFLTNKGIKDKNDNYLTAASGTAAAPFIARNIDEVSANFKAYRNMKAKYGPTWGEGGAKRILLTSAITYTVPTILAASAPFMTKKIYEGLNNKK